jgi:hypothetical protein
VSSTHDDNYNTVFECDCCGDTVHTGIFNWKPAWEYAKQNAGWIAWRREALKIESDGKRTPYLYWRQYCSWTCKRHEDVYGEQ